MARGKRKQSGGRSKGPKGKGKGKGAPSEGEEPEAKRPRNEDWRDEPWEYKNDQYEAYYRRQGICSEEDFLQMLETLRTGLPVAIRVNRMRLGAASLRLRLEELAAFSDPEMQCYAPQKLSWYSHGLGWMWPHLERRVIKKDQRHAGLKEYLAQRERAGLISRQEVVSMLPPLFLSVEPHHTVLDLCAAPGSKTFQMLEMMHWPQAENGPPPTGFILANELQWRRANMLAHQVGRLGSPCMVVVNCDAQFFPEMSSPKELGSAREIFRFDRVLCDVPCSGDGTLRKTPYIWKSWTPRDGLCLHIRQLNILYRGLELLKVGGRLVYSTCSLNPLEDEAVVAAALRRHWDSIALVAPPESMGGVKAGEGLATWAVPNPNADGDNIEFFEDFETTPKEAKTGKTKLLSTMYPPTGDFKDQWESVRRHCRRMLPHLMDTGGFFVACFEKRQDLAPSAKARREARAAQRKEAEAAEAAEAEVEPEIEGEEEKAETAEKGRAEKSSKTEVFRRLTKEYVPVSEVLPEWQEILEFYGLDASLSHRFVMRAEGDKNIFFISEAAAVLLRQEVKLPTRMVMCGVAAFHRTGAHHERACPWQLVQEGSAQLGPFLKRQLTCSRWFLRKLLAEKELTIPEVRSAAKDSEVVGLEALADEDRLSPGSVVLTLKGDKEDVEPLVPYAVVGNVSEGALELQLRPMEAQSLLEDLAGQPTVQEMLATSKDADKDEDVDEAPEMNDDKEET